MPGSAVLLVPGQGSQQPGMARDLYETFESARTLMERAEDATSIGLRRICFDLSADELRATENAQLALVTHAAMAWEVLRDLDDWQFVAAAGHSVGEYAALYCAGVLTLTDMLRLVQVRGMEMSRAGNAMPGAMAAVLGELKEPVEVLCERASLVDSIVVPANLNAPEQTVVSGHSEAVERFIVLASEAGAGKVVRLNVSGAFHSPLMAAAAPELLRALDAASFGDPAMQVYSNVSGKPFASGAEARILLKQQLTSPVRWVAVMGQMESDHPGATCLELGPGNVLSRLVKRTAPTLRSAAAGSVRDLERLSEVTT